MSEYTLLEWPMGADCPVMDIPDEYEICEYPEGDDARFNELLVLSGFEAWDTEKLRTWKMKLLPFGWFAVMHDGVIVAACAALHENDWKPLTCELSFLVRDPAHAGHGIGRAVFIEAMDRAIEAGYDHILLRTDRLNAILIYREWGFVDASV